jgi:hypothetical protein
MSPSSVEMALAEAVYHDESAPQAFEVTTRISLVIVGEKILCWAVLVLLNVADYGDLVAILRPLSGVPRFDSRAGQCSPWNIDWGMIQYMCGPQRLDHNLHPALISFWQ